MRDSVLYTAHSGYTVTLTKAQWASSIFALSNGASPQQKLISNRAEL